MKIERSCIQVSVFFTVTSATSFTIASLTLYHYYGYDVTYPATIVSLTLAYDVTIPATMTSPTLAYARYYDVTNIGLTLTLLL